MWVRIAARYGVWYEPGLLAAYRSHAQSNSGRHFANARELHYTRRAIELFRPLLPKDRAKSIIASARRAYARTALDNARQLARDGRRPAMWAHLRMAARSARRRPCAMSASPRSGAPMTLSAIQRLGAVDSCITAGAASARRLGKQRSWEVRSERKSGQAPRDGFHGHGRLPRGGVLALRIDLLIVASPHASMRAGVRVRLELSPCCARNRWR